MIVSEKEFKDICKRMGIDPKKYTEKTKKKNNHGEFDSLAEENFYNLYIQKNMKNGNIVECLLHEEFEILPAISEYKLRSKKFKPDFIIKTKNGKTYVVEMKGKVVKKLQRDYGLRKHIFISKYCIPNDWIFIEQESERWTQEPYIVSKEKIINFDE